MSKIQRALLSVSDKTEIVELAKYLVEKGVEVISTGGTQKTLMDHQIKVTPIDQFTGFPEMMDGRVKTLHPKVHGGILALRENQDHINALKQNQIQTIDLVVVNLYPFEATIAKPDVKFEEAIENIDIGGPTMIRSAAKNFEYVAVVVDPNDYDKVKLELENHHMSLSRDFRFDLAMKAFSHTAVYDSAISNFLSSLKQANDPIQKNKFSQELHLNYRKIFDLRYGENPHQKAAYYTEGWHDEPCIGNARQLHGKHLSYNNFLDLDAGLEAVKEFDSCACVIIKHTNPCGVGLSESGSVKEAYEKAFACDPTSAFGGIVAFNREVDSLVAELIHQSFFEAVVAPDFSQEALDLLKKKKNIRLLKTLPIRRYEITGWDMKKVVGGLLVQDRDLSLKSVAESEIVTERAPTNEEIKALNFAWKVVKHVKSNAIVYALEDRTVGIGAGQMSRVDSTKIGTLKAQSSLEGTVMASDAFFPFRDSIDEAAKSGVTAIIQPGGSIRDDEVIQAANENNIAMVCTGMRHFRH